MSAEVKKLILEDAAFYDAQMNEIKLRLWAEQLEDIPPAKIRAAMFKLRSEGHRFQPMPADIRKAVNPQADTEAEAQAAVGLIFEAIRIHGYTNSTDARAHMGELAWAAVNGFGGWHHLCCSPDLGSHGTIRAQLRDFCEAAILRAKQGRSDVLPSLPGSASPKLLDHATGQPEAVNRIGQLVASTVKSIE